MAGTADTFGSISPMGAADAALTGEAQDLAAELEFLKAAEAYRAAKRSGDAEATRAAEEAWREQVRRELLGM
jgi:hypothetical protein